jgi:predicted enzyme related to lactoylglutathione lyase
VPASLGLVLDCADPDRLAEFWSAALGYTTLGGAGSRYVLLAPEGDGGPPLLLQRVPEPRVAKNRMHVDLHTPDIEAEAGRLVDIGATRLAADPLAEHGSHWILMADPEGNEFCVCDGGCT